MTKLPSNRRRLLLPAVAALAGALALLLLFAGVLIGDPSPEDRAARRMANAASASAPHVAPPVLLIRRAEEAAGGQRFKSPDTLEYVFRAPVEEGTRPDVAPRNGWLHPGIVKASDGSTSASERAGASSLPLVREREKLVRFAGDASSGLSPNDQSPSRGETLAREALRDLFCARIFGHRGARDLQIPATRGGAMECASISQTETGAWKLEGAHRLPDGAPTPTPRDADENQTPSSFFRAEPTWTLSLAFEGEEWAGLYYTYYIGPRNAGGYVGMMRRVGDHWILVLWEQTWVS